MADQSRWWGRNNNIDGIDKKPFETIPSVNIGKRFGLVVFLQHLGLLLYTPLSYTKDYYSFYGSFINVCWYI